MAVDVIVIGIEPTLVIVIVIMEVLEQEALVSSLVLGVVHVGVAMPVNATIQIMDYLMLMVYLVLTMLSMVIPLHLIVDLMTVLQDSIQWLCVVHA